MIYIFCAIYAEAAGLISHYELKKVNNSLKFDIFENEAGDIRLAITGPGPVAAATAVGTVCTFYKVGGSDHIFNIGSCGGNSQPGEIFLINKLTNADSMRTFYPDMLIKSSLKEAAVVTSARLSDFDQIASNRNVLFDMEAAAIYEAGSFFLGPDNMSFIKVVSDNGGGQSLDTEGLKQIIMKALPEITDYIDRVRNTMVSESKETIVPADYLAKLAEDMRCSVTMKNSLVQLLKYAALSGTDYKKEIDDFYQKGVLPAGNKRTGKLILDELTERLL